MYAFKSGVEISFYILKESENLYKDMVKDLLDKANELPTCTKNNFKRQLGQPPCDRQMKSIDCTSETRFSSCSSSGKKYCNVCLKYNSICCQKYNNM